MPRRQTTLRGIAVQRGGRRRIHQSRDRGSTARLAEIIARGRLVIGPLPRPNDNTEAAELYRTEPEVRLGGSRRSTLFLVPHVAFRSGRVTFGRHHLAGQLAYTSFPSFER